MNLEYTLHKKIVIFFRPNACCAILHQIPKGNFWRVCRPCNLASDAARTSTTGLQINWKNLAQVSHKSESNPFPCLTRSGQSGSIFQLLLYVLLYRIKQLHAFLSYSLSVEFVWPCQASFEILIILWGHPKLHFAKDRKRVKKKCLVLWLAI